MWAVCGVLGVISIFLCYQGMITLDAWLLGASMIIAVIALFTLMLVGGGKDGTD